MNTNNVYFAKVYRITKRKLIGSTIYDRGINYTLSFCRYTLAYEKEEGKFYDLMKKKPIKVEVDYLIEEIGTEIMDINSLIDFNLLTKNTKENLSKRKIKKLYIEHANNVNNK